MRRTVVAAVAGAALLLTVSACGGNDAPEDKPADKNAAETSKEAPEEQAPVAEGPGTRDAPLAVGTTVTLSTWEISMGASTLNANDIVAAENEFNDPPLEGRQFVMAPVNVVYKGEESGTPWVDLSLNFVSSAGNTYGMSMDDYCGVIPNDLSDVGEMYKDATGSGNVCMSVPAGEIEGGVWVIEDFTEFSGDKVFFAVQ